MSDTVIRRDVVQLSFEGGALKEIQKLQKEFDELKKKLGMMDDDPFDETKESADKATTSVNKLSKASGTAFKALKKIAGITFKAALAGVGAAGAGIVKVTTDAAQAYSEFEQLEGGMKKIFDEADISGITKDANNAFKTLGMSANQYLAVINDTGANFAAIMGDQKGYDVAKLGLTAISDYASGTGKSIDELSEKYTMITRSTSSYQSIADQFSGILPATSADFLKQAKAAGFLEKKYKKLTDVPIAEYQEAVTKMLEKGVESLGLTGNTAAEAEKTFSGSLGMMKASWGNLLTAIGSGEGLDKCFDNMIYAAEKFGDNLFPVVERALVGIGTLIEKLAPKIEEKLPQLAKDLLPPLIKAAVSLAKGLAKSLPSIIDTVIITVIEIFEEQFPQFKKITDFFRNNAKKIGTALKTIIPAVIGVVAAFKLFNKVKGITSIFGKKSGGVLGGATEKNGLFEKLKKTKFKDILGAIGKIAVVLGALAGLVYLAGALAKLMRKQDMKATEILQLVGLMTAIGVAGGVITEVAGIVGKIPFPVVLSGIASIATVIGAMEAIFVVLGALNSIKGFQGLIEKGGELLAVTFGAIGKAIGSLIGGIMEGISKGAAGAMKNIGQGIADFTNALSGADFDVLRDFFDALSGVKAVPSAGGIFGLFTGDPYNGMLKMAAILPFLGASVKTFTAIVGNNADFSSLSSLLSAIASLKGAPNAGGIAQLFAGDAYNGLVKMTEVLPELGTAAKAFMQNIGGVVNFTPLQSFLQALSAVSNLPNAGGFWQSIAGDPYEGLKTMLGALPSLALSVVSFFAILGDIKDFSPITNLLTAISVVSNLPSAGGFWQSIAGDPYEGLKLMMGYLPTLAASVLSFFTILGDIRDFSPITNLLTAVSTVSNLPSAGGFWQSITGDPYEGLKLMFGYLPTMAASVLAFYSIIGDRTDFSAITAVMKAISDVDQLQSAGGVKQFFTGDPYAALQNMIALLPKIALSVSSFYSSLNGIDDFSKITALFTTLGGLKDLIGKEGGLFDSIGELFSGSEESALIQLGYSLQTFGTLTKDFFAQINAFNAEAFGAIFDSLASLEEKVASFKNTLAVDFEEMVKTVTDQAKNIEVVLSSTDLYSAGSTMMTSWLNGITSKRTAIYNTVSAIAREVGRKINNAMNSINAKTRGYARGTGGHPGGNAIVNDGRGAELVQMPSGLSFVASGRNVLLPNAPEGMKVLDAQKTAWLFGRQTPTFNYSGGTGSAEFSHYTPSGSITSRSTSETNTYAPVFNLTINGTEDARGLERKVKRWIREAMDDTFNSMARRSPRLQEV